MNQEEIIKQLREPFPFEEIETKIQAASGDKTKGLAVFHLDDRAVQERLDKVIGPFDWRNEYLPGRENAQICGLSLYNAERGEWVTKYDCAENSEILTDSFKRSAVLWGIGRYLHQMEGVWVDVEQHGESYCIKDDQQSKLKSEYDNAAARIFNTPAACGDTVNNAAPAIDNTEPSETAQQATASQTAPADTSSKPAQPDMDSHQQPVTPAYDYQVRAVKPSGKASQLLELVDNNGEMVTAYIKAGDQAIAAGSCLREVEMTQKAGAYGEYNLIYAYQLAA